MTKLSTTLDSYADLFDDDLDDVATKLDRPAIDPLRTEAAAGLEGFKKPA